MTTESISPTEIEMKPDAVAPDAAPVEPAPEAAPEAPAAESKKAKKRNAPSAPRNEAKAAEKAKAADDVSIGDHVVFVSPVPDLEIQTGDGSHRFENGRLVVPARYADKFLRHHLYQYEHFFRIEEVVVVDGKIVAIKKHAEVIQKAHAENKVVFLFKENPALSLIMPTANGLEQVNFHDGVCVADQALAAVLRKHIFFVEGRMKEAKNAVEVIEHE